MELLKIDILEQTGIREFYHGLKFYLEFGEEISQFQSAGSPERREGIAVRVLKLEELGI